MAVGSPRHFTFDGTDNTSRLLSFDGRPLRCAGAAGLLESDDVVDVDAVGGVE
ncbi:hypothetical protein AADR41_10325 [Streptomyces sp. CLV115]|uniref:hypothetical protein n=1 Tax=Streptomyces sp. CLV115 TaxID=3138502 RepID=UPI00313F0CD3